MLDGCLVPGSWRIKGASGVHAPIRIQRSRSLSLGLLHLLLWCLSRRGCLRRRPPFAMCWVHFGVCDSSAAGKAAKSLKRRVSGRRAILRLYKARPEPRETAKEQCVRGDCSVVAVVQLLEGGGPYQLELVLISSFGGGSARRSKANAVKLCRHILRPCSGFLYRRAS